jgi:malonyl-CoA O-methyltransferase
MLQKNKSFNKELINKNFSRAAFSYEEIATIQKAAAKKLVALASPFLNQSQILDLGSGTGFVAKELLQKNNQLKIVETDLSREMLSLWKNRPENVIAIECDIENLPFAKNSFDIITSSFVLHWLNDFEKSFEQFSNILKPNGILAFCLPTSETLKELRTAGIFHFNNFPEISYIEAILEKNNLTKINFDCEIIKQEFDSGYNALKFIKKLGGNHHAKPQIISKNQLKQFNNFCLKNSCPTTRKFSISWENSFFIYQK